MSRLKLTFSYVMRAGEKVVCTATSTHCFMENGRPVSLETRFPAFYALITE
jgi:acyl-CoA thioester hydrolase